MPEDTPAGNSNIDPGEEQRRVLALLIDKQIEAAQHVFQSAARSTAMQTELRSGQGMVTGAVIGCLLGGLLVAWTNVLSAPLALLLVAACSGLGWMRARYKGALAALPDTVRTTAEAHLQILYIELRAIDESNLPPPTADAARADAFARFSESLKNLQLPGLSLNRPPEPREKASDDDG